MNLWGVLRSVACFALTARPGKATRPQHLPSRAPACFSSQKLWNSYREDAVYSAGDGFTFCTDCDPARRDAMVKQNRCAHPSTTFVKLADGIIVGRRKK